MTSTSFNVGLHDGKNSSRVLKPPGGGHSDIFGIHPSEDNSSPIKRKNAPQTTITSCFYHQEADNKPHVKPVENLEQDKLETETNGKLVENGANGHGPSTPDENTAPVEEKDEKEEETKTAIPEPPRRVRVPPGGFSSGLW